MSPLRSQSQNPGSACSPASFTEDDTALLAGHQVSSLFGRTQQCHLLSCAGICFYSSHQAVSLSGSNGHRACSPPALLFIPNQSSLASSSEPKHHKHKATPFHKALPFPSLKPCGRMEKLKCFWGAWGLLRSDLGTFQALASTSP